MTFVDYALNKNLRLFIQYFGINILRFLSFSFYIRYFLELEYGL
jgi:hypothetical protein